MNTLVRGIIGVSDHGCWAVLVTVWRDGTLLDRRLQRLVPAKIRCQVFGARHSLLVAASPLGAACACILAGVGGLVSPSLGRKFRPSD